MKLEGINIRRYSRWYSIHHKDVNHTTSQQAVARAYFEVLAKPEAYTAAERMDKQ